MRSTTLPPDLATVAREATRNGNMRSPARTARILGLGHHLPPEVVPNGPIADRIGVDDAWIVKRTGIRSRRRAADDERLADLATFAARKALADAGVEPYDVDLILVATMSPDELTPNVAPIVANALGLTVGAYDVGAACTGFLSALSAGAAQVETGRADVVLVVGAEILSRLTDPDDKRTASLFGDGAGAVVLGAAGEGEIGPILLETDGGMAETINGTHAERYIRMDGHTTFNKAVKVLMESTRSAVERAGLTLEDIDLFVYHQANGRILRAVGQRLGLPEEKVADYVAGMANTSAASIPIALGLLREDGRLRAGQRLIVGAVGGGFTWGAGIVEWGLA